MSLLMEDIAAHLVSSLMWAPRTASSAHPTGCCPDLLLHHQAGKKSRDLQETKVKRGVHKIEDLFTESGIKLLHRLPYLPSLWSQFSQLSTGQNTLTQSQIRKALNDLGLYPTHSQICELVHAACETGGRTPVDHITFGEYCFLVTELQECYRRSPSRSPPRSQLPDRALLALEERRRKRRLSAFREVELRNMIWHVFLGGSCNPTTWRHDVAIPFLQTHDITFYNPQVSNWRPELIEIEDQAKQTAELLFFVIDNQTRSTASMVEAAYLAGCGRELVLVIRNFQGPVTIYGETLSTVEVEDLDRSHAFLTDLVERQGIPVFSTIDSALKCTEKVLKQNQTVTELRLEDGAQPVRYPHIRVADKFMQTKAVFNSSDPKKSGRLCYRDVALAYRTITDEVLPLPPVNAGTTYTFDDFCCLLAEFRYKRKSILQRLLLSVGRFHARILDWIRGHHSRISRPIEGSIRWPDVFLGGTCGKSTWREAIAKPLLRKHGISFFDPQLEDWTTRYIPMEAAMKDACRLLLYVVAADTRGITSMLEAGYYIGQGCNIVLCLQSLEEGADIEGEKLTLAAVKDYNRARTYLADLANRDGVPVFEDVHEAVDCVTQRLAANPMS